MKILADFGQSCLFCSESYALLVYFLQAQIMRWCLKIDKYQVWIICMTKSGQCKKFRNKLPQMQTHQVQMV